MAVSVNHIETKSKAQYASKNVQEANISRTDKS